MSPAPFENPPADAAVPQGAAVATPNATDATISEAWVTIRSRKKLILAVASLGAIYGLYSGYTQPKLYDSSGTIEIRNGSSNEYKIGTTSRLGNDESSRIATEVAILKSDSLMLSVARDLNLANNPYFGGGGPYRSVDEPARPPRHHRRAAGRRQRRRHYQDRHHSHQLQHAQRAAILRHHQ